MTDEPVPTEPCPTHHIPLDGPCPVCEHAPGHAAPLSDDEAEYVALALRERRRHQRAIADINEELGRRFQPPVSGPSASELARRAARMAARDAVMAQDALGVAAAGVSLPRHAQALRTAPADPGGYPEIADLGKEQVMT